MVLNIKLYKIGLLIRKARGTIRIEELYNLIKSIPQKEYDKFSYEILDARGAHFDFSKEDFEDYLNWLKTENPYTISKTVILSDKENTYIFLKRDKTLEKKPDNIFHSLKPALKNLGLSEYEILIKNFI